MSGNRPMFRSLPRAGAVMAAVTYGVVIRPRLLTWGATRAEAAGDWPGDELIPQYDGQSTMATTLPAPPDAVWPWLVQMGCNRAGWYSFDRLDNAGRPSAERIVAQWQGLKEGQRLEAVPDGGAWFTAALVEPERDLVLRMTLELPSGHPFDARFGPLSGAYTDAVWGFHLRRTEQDGTRLVVRTRGRSRPRPITRPLDLLLWEPVHLLMQLRQFRNLRTRVSADPQSRTDATTAR
ncbi:hypothetical protein ADK86_27675 [Streptomyces sp. NRRL F-5755]|uniref:hypothetical protein n=1 Tax=Streptomyces sp. NRRL F-5755 TaxID=1519475 RepID=UPI0006AE9E02|nr:hypothetical protein [Streptomyces sp. NRRL F-5755]KOT89929.1 hypothetical protein ADK86_27675 [Streptomyces sp. NRRL F-5755]